MRERESRVFVFEFLVVSEFEGARAVEGVDEGDAVPTPFASASGAGDGG
jgi:hypothetical protein